MKRVFKYPLVIADRQLVDLPIGAEVLTVQVQRAGPFLWALIDDAAQTCPCAFVTVGTGHPMPLGEPFIYVGTYQLDAGALVFHVFKEWQ